VFSAILDAGRIKIQFLAQPLDFLVRASTPGHQQFGKRFTEQLQLHFFLLSGTF